MTNWRNEMIRPPELKLGDRVYVSSVTWSMEDARMVPYKVTKVNSKWIYVRNDKGRKRKFSQNTWTVKTQFGFGTDYMMLKISDYWNENELPGMRKLGYIHKKKYWSPLNKNYLDSVGR